MIVPISYAHRTPKISRNTNDGDMEVQGPGEAPVPQADSEGEDDDEDVEYLRKFFVMPDFHRIMKGYVKEEGEVFAADEQVNSFFSLPHWFKGIDDGV